MLYHYVTRFVPLVVVALLWAGSVGGQTVPATPTAPTTPAASGPITKSMDVVTLDLAGRTFLGANGAGIPFDMPFQLTGNADGIERLELRYRIQPDQTRRAYFYVLANGDVHEKFKVDGASAGIKVKVLFDKVENATFLIVTLKKGFSQEVHRINPPAFRITFNENVSDFINPAKTLAKGTSEIATLAGTHLNVQRDGKLVEFTPIKLDIVSWHYLPEDTKIGLDGYTRSVLAWDRQSLTGNTFSLTVPALHPNVKYEFQFSVFFKPDLPIAETTKLKKEVLDALGSIMRVETVNFNTTETIKQVNEKLNTIVQSKMVKRGDLVNADGTALVVDMTTFPFKNLTDSLLNHYIVANEMQYYRASSYKALTQNRPSVVKGNGYLRYIQHEINSINNGLLILTAKSKVLYQQEIVEGVTVAEVSDIIANEAQFTAIVNGRAEITAAGQYRDFPAGSRPANTQSIVYMLEVMQHLLLAPITDNTTNSLHFKTVGVKEMVIGLERLLNSHGNGPEAIQYARDLLVAPSVLPGLLYSTPSTVNLTLGTALAHPELLTPIAKELLGKPLNPGLLDYKGITVLQAGSFVYDALNNPTYLEEIVKGGARVSLNGIGLERKAGKAVDVQSVKLVLDFLRLVNSPVFQKQGPPTTPLFSPADAASLHKLIGELDYFLAGLEKLNDNLAQSVPRGTHLADLLVNKYIAQHYLVSGTSTVNMNVAVEKNPYVGLDFGLGVAPQINTVFIHEGFNIYLRPVNKDTPLSDLHGSDRFLKSLSLFVGFTQTISSNTLNQEYANLFDEGVLKSSFLFGAGYRVARFIRLNVSGLVYRQINQNPLITSRSINVTPTLSLAFDINVGKALSTAGKIFR